MSARDQPDLRSWVAGVLLLLVVPAGLGLGWEACTQDDAFISFRYAANLLDGHGLVFNPGERVEGYTNLLWTLLLTIPMALGGDPATSSLTMGLGSLGFAVVLTGLLGRQGSGGGRAHWGLLLVAPALVATDAFTILEAAEGLETAFYMALITGAVVQVFVERGRSPRGWTTHLGSSVLFAGAALTRPEAPLIAVLVHGGLLIISPDRRGQLVRSAGAGVPIAVVLLALTIWRYSYYGDWLPNTFYAKTGGFALPRGLMYLWHHIRFHPVLWLLLGARLVVGRWSPVTAPLMSVVCGYLCYVAWIGGDFKPTGRFVMPVLGLMAVLAQETVVVAWERWKRPAGLVAVLGLLATIWSGWTAKSAADGWAEDRRANFHARQTVGLFLRARLPPDTLIAIHSAGAIPFYAELPTIDMWGLTDRHIARAPAPAVMGAGLAGHERGDPEYVFGRNPAIYLPEDRVFTLRAHRQTVEPGFPEDFAERYTPISVPVEGRFLNVWVRKGFLKALHGG